MNGSMMDEKIYTLYKLVDTFKDMNESIPGSNSKNDILLKMVSEIEKQLETVKTELKAPEPKTTKTMFDFNQDCSSSSSKPL